MGWVNDTSASVFHLPSTILPLLCFAAASAASAITLLLAAADGGSVSCCLLLLMQPLGGMHV